MLGHNAELVLYPPVHLFLSSRSRYVEILEETMLDSCASATNEVEHSNGRVYMYKCIKM